MLIILIFHLGVCNMVGNIAKEMGYSKKLWFFISFVIDPLISFFLLTILPNNKMRKSRIDEKKILRKQLSSIKQFRKPDNIIKDPLDFQSLGDEETIY